MDEYRLFIRSTAAAELEALPGTERQSAIDAIRLLAGEPRPTAAHHIAAGNRNRIHAGGCRILYEIDDARGRVLISAIRTRDSTTEH